MSSQILPILLQYICPLFLGVILGLIVNATIVKKMQKKLHEYREKLAKSESQLLKLEHENKLLSEQLENIQKKIPTERIFLN